MAKRRKPKTPSDSPPGAATTPPDRHQSGFLVRLPEPHRAALALLKTKHRRPITVEIQIALEKHYESEGIPFALPQPPSAKDVAK